MSIARVFRVLIHADLRSEFEPKFNTLSKGIVACAPGCIRQAVLKPTKWNPNEYAMISEWKSEGDLIAFAGEKWSESVIPSGMKKIAESHSGSHFQSWE